MHKDLLDLLLEMEERRTRYTEQNAKDGDPYQRGRRDEAGHFRDKLLKILQANPNEISVPFVQIPPYTSTPYKIICTGDDSTRYITYSIYGDSSLPIYKRFE